MVIWVAILPKIGCNFKILYFWKNFIFPIDLFLSSHQLKEMLHSKQFLFFYDHAILNLVGARQVQIITFLQLLPGDQSLQ